MEHVRSWAIAEDGERVVHALNEVFRRLLANLLLDFNNEKYRKVRPTNDAIRRNTVGLSDGFITFLFDTLGFPESSRDEDGFLHFSGTTDTLKSADDVFSLLEQHAHGEKEKNAVPLRIKSRGRAEPNSASATPPPPVRGADTLPPKARTVDSDKDDAESTVFCPDDFLSVDPLKPVVTKTLLNTGRVRNCFFEAKGLTVRRMAHGRVYMCSEKCSTDCLEAHWHLIAGKGMLYSYVAHLSSDGASLLHLGIEYGYQYNSVPGTENFGKTVLFTEKLTTAEGRLAVNKHPNKPVDSCIYCATPFSKLFL